MKKISPKKIAEIAQELDCGLHCYYNHKTEEVIAIPTMSPFFDENEFNEMFAEDLEKVKNQSQDLIQIHPLESSESFKIMEQFTQQLTDTHLQVQLSEVLQNKNPFQKFKNIIDHSQVKQQWFRFKIKSIEQRVETIINI